MEEAKQTMFFNKNNDFYEAVWCHYPECTGMPITTAGLEFILSQTYTVFCELYDTEAS